MRKIIALTLILLAIFSFHGCSSKEEISSDATENISIIETVPNPDSLVSEGIIDGDTVYDKGNIRIGYIGKEYDLGVYDEYYFTVKNNSEKNIVFSVSSIAVNGLTISATTDAVFVAKGDIGKVTVQTLMDTRYSVCKTPEDAKCLKFTGFIAERPKEDEFKYTNIIDDNISFEITESGHSHEQDKAIIKGNLVYENDEVSIYVNPEPSDNYPYNQFDYTIINKLDHNIFVSFDNIVFRIRYMVAGTTKTTFALGMKSYIPPKAFSTGTFYLHGTRGQNITEMEIAIDACQKTVASNYTDLTTKDPLLACDGKKFKIDVIMPDTQ